MSERTHRDGTGPFHMTARISTRLPRSSADRLLDEGVGPEPLRRILAAAGGPAQAGELGGEQAAQRAFATAARYPPLPGVLSPGSRRRTRALSWIVAAKAVAAVALTAGAGGVAMAATSGSLPGTLPDVSTSRTADPDPSTARPTVVVDRARGTAERPGTGPAAESSPGSPGPHRVGTDPAATPSTAAPRLDQPGRPGTEAVPGNPQQAKDDEKPAATTPPGQQKDKDKENQGKKPADTKKTDSPENSDHVGNPRSDTAKQQERAGQE